ncbi:MAG: hypothetical protein ACREOR_09215 [Candidatus Binatia bacterium]
MASKGKASIIDIGALPLFIVLGLIGVLVGSRWFLEPSNMVIDGGIVSAIGFVDLLRVRFSALRRGVGTDDPTRSDVGVRDYKPAFALMCIGALLVLVANALVEHGSP